MEFGFITKEENYPPLMYFFIEIEYNNINMIKGDDIMELTIKLYNDDNFCGYNQIEQIQNFVPLVNNVEVTNEYYEDNKFVTECKVNFLGDNYQFEDQLIIAQLNDINYKIDNRLIF